MKTSLFALLIVGIAGCSSTVDTSSLGAEETPNGGLVVVPIGDGGSHGVVDTPNCCTGRTEGQLCGHSPDRGVWGSCSSEITDPNQPTGTCMFQCLLPGGVCKEAPADSGCNDPCPGRHVYGCGRLR